MFQKKKFLAKIKTYIVWSTKFLSRKSCCLWNNV